MSLPEALKNQLEVKLGEPVLEGRQSGGGCISQATSIRLQGGRELFLKFHSNSPKGFFSAEARGLQELAAPGVIRVPKVIAVDDTPEEGPAYIVIESLNPGASGSGAKEEFGRSLAALHLTRSESFGLEQNNYIGSSPQDNTIKASEGGSAWSEFFLIRRLLPQAQMGETNGWFDASFARLLAKKEKNIRELLAEEPEEPTLLHGDLWSGNVFWSDQGPALIDPAVYYGNREADLAFLELFGGPGRSFFAAYSEVNPIKAGYERRRTVLNLYHLMNHANLFGGSYIGSVRRDLASL